MYANANRRGSTLAKRPAIKANMSSRPACHSASTPPPSMTKQRATTAQVATAGCSTNPSLRQYLRWNQDRYFAARDGLVDKGLVFRRPGRGGG
jgi:hypothetical protein